MHPRNYRKQVKRMSQTAFAEWLGVDQRTISFIETGERRPTADLALRYEIKSRGKVRLRDFPGVKVSK